MRGDASPRFCEGVQLIRPQLASLLQSHGSTRLWASLEGAHHSGLWGGADEGWGGQGQRGQVEPLDVAGSDGNSSRMGAHQGHGGPLGGGLGGGAGHTLGLASALWSPTTKAQKGICALPSTKGLLAVKTYTDNIAVGEQGRHLAAEDCIWNIQAQSVNCGKRV